MRSNSARRLETVFSCGLVLSVMTSAAFADVATLDLIPISGNIAGPPGSTIGWGYTISNNSADWLQPESLNADVFQNGTPNNIFDFPAVAPSSSVTLGFSLVATASCGSPPCGLYELTWDNTAPVGFSNSGTFSISSEFFDQDPTNPGATDLGAAPDVSASYSATVSAQTNAVPEPSAFWLLAAGLAGLEILRCKRRMKLPASCSQSSCRRKPSAIRSTISSDLF